ncbi:MAG: lysophospholipid acyltransferase family protein [Polyangiales bacterium]
MAEGSFGLALLGLAETLRISAPTVAESMFGRKTTRQVCNDRLDAWAERIERKTGIDLHVHGRDTIPRDENFVVMSNHQSLYDIPILFRALPQTLRMVAKSELFKIPIFGAALEVAEFVSLDRGDKTKAREGIKAAQDRIRSGVNVWIAPEGTRSPTGKLGPFKGGGFKLALETETRILPVTLVGSGKVLPAKGAFVNKGQRVDVFVHAPIDPADYGASQKEQLTQAVRAAIESSLPPELRT